MDIVLVIEGLLIGCLLGLTGAGGSVIAIPALMLSQHWTVLQAAPVGLMTATVGSFVGAMQGLLRHVVRYRAAVWIALISIPFARLGISVSQLLSPSWLSFIFSLIMLWVGYRTFSKSGQEEIEALCKIDQDTGRFIWTRKTAGVLATIGIMVGFLTGLLGVGGGFVVVPILRKFTELDIKNIIGTSLFIVFLVGTLSVGLHVLDGYRFPVGVTVTFIASAVVGVLVGRSLTDRISARKVQQIFALTVIGVAFYLLAEALPQLGISL